ncbi:MAG: hypothetical protein U1F25_02250 [Rubrivivax sp.]
MEGPDDPRAALRWSLAKLRPLVNGGAAVRLVAERDTVQFRPDGVEVDIAAVRALVKPGTAAQSTTALEETAQLLAGEFLDGLDLPRCHRFHEWCMAERESRAACAAASCANWSSAWPLSPKGRCSTRAPGPVPTRWPSPRTPRWFACSARWGGCAMRTNTRAWRRACSSASWPFR